jgi:predicted DNA-binding transcriptional regulator YafY
MSKADMEDGMSFKKAGDLIRMAEMAASRYRGICLDDVRETWGVSQRTAQRMIREFEEAFPGYDCIADDDRRRWWKLDTAPVSNMRGLSDGELAALEMSIRRAQRDGAPLEAKSIASLRDRLLGNLPGPHARRAEADAAAALEAQGFACRPGPRVQAKERVLQVIAVAIQAPFSMHIEYRNAKEETAHTRLVEPYGVLLGTRRYLIARDVERGGALWRYRIDRIEDASITGSSFKRDPGFDLDAYAAKAFGSFYSDAEYAQIVWRFRPSAAKVARDFEFHPDQVLIDEPDGSLRVEFKAAGWLEMAWHLYQWGDAVEVLEPQELRDMVEGFQRGDFVALP